jgi:hypothetical protein
MRWRQKSVNLLRHVSTTLESAVSRVAADLLGRSPSITVCHGNHIRWPWRRHTIYSRPMLFPSNRHE